jgi:hypothetical protein
VNKKSKLFLDKAIDKCVEGIFGSLDIDDLLMLNTHLLCNQTRLTPEQFLTRVMFKSVAVVKKKLKALQKELDENYEVNRNKHIEEGVVDG